MDSDEETLDFDTLDNCSLKTLLNIISNVILNPKYKDEISKEQKRLLKPHMPVFEKLLDKTVPLTEKRKILKKNEKKYIPTFLDIVGEEDLDYFKPKMQKRKRRDCEKGEM